MALYLVRFGYTAESWAALLAHPQDRRDQLAARIFGFGGRLQGFWYSLGEHDGYAITEFPDEVSWAAAHVALKASGAFDHLEATKLVSVDDMVEAMQRANDFAYARPGA
jgi:uncharacterized protein with GYD domain